MQRELRCRRASLVCIFSLLIAILSGCDEQIVHDLTERDANKVVSRLGAERLSARKIVQPDGRWAIAVARPDAIPALAFLENNRVLTTRPPSSLPHNKSGLVPSREEQWFRYERSVATSIEDSLSTVLGVLEARVHLNLPETDPLFGTRKESVGSGSALLIVDARYGSKDEEIAALIAGAAGIPSGKVTVLLSRAQTTQVESDSRGSSAPTQHESPQALSIPEVAASFSLKLPVLMGVASIGGLGLVSAGLMAILRRRRRVRFPLPKGFEQVEE